MPVVRSVRKRLIVRYTLIALAGVGALTAVVFGVREKPAQYSPGEVVEGITSELDRGLPPGFAPAVRFVDVAAEAGLRFTHFPGARTTQLPEDMGSGAAWGDYNNDGYPDLFVANIAGPLTAAPGELTESNRLYRNNGDGTFTDVTAAAGVGYQGIGMAAAWADYDHDGHLDLVVTAYRRLLLYRNRGDGTFEEVSHRAGMAGFERFWAGASWGDYDRDGDLDLYVCAYVDYRFDPRAAGRTSRQFASDVPYTLNPSSYPPEPNALFRNNGDGSFTEVAEAAGVANPTGRSLSAAWCDFDRDGWLDLYVANDVSDNALFRNLGGGRFEDVSHPTNAADYRGAMGLAVGDYDADGDPDIFVTHWLAQENALFWNQLHAGGAAANGHAQLRFMDIADMLGLGQIALSAIGWGTSFFDYDNDGRLDLFVVNGSTMQDVNDPRKLVPMKNFLMWQRNERDGFFDVAAAAGPALLQAHVGRGAAFADYDRDGDIDIVVINFGEPPMLLRNEGGNRRNWIRVRARGAQSNRDGIGAVVEVTAVGRTQTQWIGSQPSYLSQNPSDAHFGLGEVSRIDRIRVVFPLGAVRELNGIAVNQEVVVTE
ncbi:MAG: CRTAC1 family protein [Bryobacteraceae bacterium]|nr:CRTAC1 family protein [Bryobacteraceae bacterium]